MFISILQIILIYAGVFVGTFILVDHKHSRGMSNWIAYLLMSMSYATSLIPVILLLKSISENH
jgi:hypothetical protein